MKSLRILTVFLLSLSACATPKNAPTRFAEALDAAHGSTLDQSELQESCDAGERAACAYLGSSEASLTHLSEAERAFQKSCKLNDPYGCQRLGAFYFEQLRFEEALTPFTTACNQKLYESCAYLGVIEQGKNHLAQAKKYFTTGCDHWNIWACVRLGYLSEFNQDFVKAKQLYQTACELGEPFVSCTYAAEMKLLLGDATTGKLELNVQCDGGTPLACRLTKALEQNTSALTKSCNSNDGSACLALGLKFEVDKRRRKESSRYLEKGCKLNNAGACWELAYDRERTGDLKSFRKETFKACELGAGIACYDEAMDVASSVENSREEVSALRKKACDLGEAYGCILNSDYRKACEMGNQAGCYDLAGTLPKGTERTSILNKACELKYGWACSELGYDALLEKDTDRGIALYQTACSLNAASSCDWALWERFNKEPKEEFISRLRERCKSGHVTACSRGAKIFQDKHDDTAAQEFYKIGCDLNDGFACSNLVFKEMQ